MVLTRSRLFFTGVAVVDDDEDSGDGTNDTSAREHDDDDDLDGIVALSAICSTTTMKQGSMVDKGSCGFSCEAS